MANPDFRARRLKKLFGALDEVGVGIMKVVVLAFVGGEVVNFGGAIGAQTIGLPMLIHEYACLVPPS